MTGTLPTGTGGVWRPRRRRFHRWAVALNAILLVVVTAGMALGLAGRPAKAVGDAAALADEPPLEPVTAVKVIRPKRDPNFRVSNQQLATVEPFYQAWLRARASGVVKFVAKDIGEPVRAGELLVEIDVPDLRQTVDHKEAIVEQRWRELEVADTSVAAARAAVTAAAVNVRVKEVDVNRMKDIRTAKKTYLDQVTELFNSKTVQQGTLDIATLDHQAALRAVESAEAEVEKARSELAGKNASLEKAVADVKLARALVEVARKDRDVATAQLGYARIFAPFDGVIVRRTIDPGMFVQNATTGVSEPLITVARTDLVTITTKLPDNAAAFVTRNTEAVVEFEQLPGLVIRGPLTRFSPVIDPADRTLRVEVDVYNGTRDEYRNLLNRAAAETTFAPLLPFDRFAGVVSAGTGQILTKFDHKGWHEGAALIPDWSDGRPRQIIPGMTGTLRVYLDRFTDAYLLPAGAVVSRGGRSFILVVVDGRTRTVPVVVQVNDGRLVKVAVVSNAAGRQVTKELTGNEVIVSTRQQEVGDDQRVDAVFEEW